MNKADPSGCEGLAYEEVNVSQLNKITSRYKSHKEGT